MDKRYAPGGKLDVGIHAVLLFVRTIIPSGLSLLRHSEPPDADPHVRWRGEGERKTLPYPIGRLLVMDRG